ncbi:tape measure protein [uncultured Megasphaera sp.]|uniref:tape measure protein n=1 Tax=uncultured Megasphaera sp. TaxID=165188 RepID=UPI00260A74F2|nr:tape measure protein [uncultured Megasphaera sp.]
MVVRELITKISFAVNRGGLDAANNGISRLKRSLGGIGGASSMASRMFGNSAANMAASATKAEMGISRIKSSVNSLMGSLGPLAGAMAAAFSISAIKNTADEMMSLDGRLRSVTSSEEERRGVETQLYELSQNNRSALAEMGDLYFSTARACKQMGRSQEDAMRTTDIVSKALTLGGATTEQAKASILQLGQALGSGVLQGDELHSLGENASLLMQHMAESIGVPQAALKDMGKQGQLTSDMVIDAILASGAAIDSEFKGIPLTIGQALTQASNSWKIFILRIEQGTGVFSDIATSLSQVFKEISQGMNDIVTIMSGPGDTADSMAAFEKAKEAHPYIVAIGDALKTVYNLLNQIGEATGIDNLITKTILIAGAVGVLAGVFSAVGAVVSAVAGVFSAVGAVVSAVAGVISGAIGFIAAAGWPVVAVIAAIAAAIYFVKNHWDEVMAAFSPGLEMMKQGLAFLADAWERIQPFITALIPPLKMVAEVVGGVIVAALGGFFRIAGYVFRGVAALIDTVASALQKVGEFIQWCADGLASLINKAKDFLGMGGQISAEGSALESFANRVIPTGNSYSNTNNYQLSVGTVQDAIGFASGTNFSPYG